MSKAIIKANKGKGLYTVEVEYDHGAIDARLAQLNAGLESLGDQITDLNEQLADAEAVSREADQALKDAFTAYEDAKLAMDTGKATAIEQSAVQLAKDIAKVRGAHDATVDRIDDRVADAAVVRQEASAAATAAYAVALADYDSGIDQAAADYTACVADGTAPSICYDNKQDAIEQLEQSLADAVQTRDEAIAAADDAYSSVYRQGQRDIDASENARDNAIAEAEAANEQRIADIKGNFTALDEPAKAVSAANTEHMGTRLPVDRLNSRLAELKIRKLTLTQQVALLSKARTDRLIDAWCADYTTLLQAGDQAGLIWPSIDANTQPILMPGGTPASEGAIKSELAMGPASSFFNRAIMPILQRMKPRHMIGSVTAVNDDGTLNVALRAHLSRFGRVNTVISSTLSGVLVEYMKYGALAFGSGDDVVVRFDGIDQTQPVVIGFERGPKITAGMTITSTKGSTYATVVDSVWQTKSFIDPAPVERAEWQNDQYLLEWSTGKGFSRSELFYTQDMSRNVNVNRKFLVSCPFAHFVIGASVDANSHIWILSAYVYRLNIANTALVMFRGMLGPEELIEPLQEVSRTPATFTNTQFSNSHRDVSLAGASLDGGQFSTVISGINSYIYRYIDGLGPSLKQLSKALLWAADYSDNSEVVAGDYQISRDNFPNTGNADIGEEIRQVRIGDANLETMTDTFGSTFSLNFYGFDSDNDTADCVAIDLRNRIAIYMISRTKTYTSERLVGQDPYIYDGQTQAELVLYSNGSRQVLWSGGQSYRVISTSSKRYTAKFLAGGIRSRRIAGDLRSIAHGVIQINSALSDTDALPESFVIDLNQYLIPYGGSNSITPNPEQLLGIL